MTSSRGDVTKLCGFFGLVGNPLASYDQLCSMTLFELCHACCHMCLSQGYAHYKIHHVHSLMKQVGMLTNICLVTFMWNIPIVLYRIIKYKQNTVKNNPVNDFINPLHAELNFICHLLALLAAHHIFHVSGLRVKVYSYIVLSTTCFGSSYEPFSGCLVFLIK
jgi:hypothetical protein